MKSLQIGKESRLGAGRLILAATLLALKAALLAGCVGAPIKGRNVSLDFLKDGETTKREVLLNLTSSCGEYEHGRILTYRLDFDPRNRGYYLSESPSWEGANYSLVLVFNDVGVLQRYSLVKVR